MRSTAAGLTCLALLIQSTAAQGVVSLTDLAARWNLDAAHFDFAMPTETLDSDAAQKWVRENWDLASKIDWGGSNIVFSPDPSTTSATLVRRQSHSRTSTGSRTSSATASSTQSVSAPASTDLNGEPPVLRIGYPQGSYSKRTGGTQFYAAPLNATGGGSVEGNSTSDGQYERMLLAYDVWFPTGFAWNMGGKLPGLRGGPDLHGCSGGNETDGTSCFSTRLMWRSGGAGEVYAYIPTTQKGFCSASEITCNSDYGTSLARGSIHFATGQWQTIYLVVVLNKDDVANGVVELYYNGVQAMSLTNLVIRTSSNIASIGGLFFSTFFGGDDATWATPTNQYTYYRNMAVYGGYGAANGTGSAISGAGRVVPGWSVLAGTAVVAITALLGMAL